MIPEMSIFKFMFPLFLMDRGGDPAMRERATVSALPPLRPHRALGQNFLRDPNVARKIVDAIAPGREDTVLEIGPGEGALTRELAARAGRLVIVDLDERVIRAHARKCSPVRR